MVHLELQNLECLRALEEAQPEDEQTDQMSEAPDTASSTDVAAKSPFVSVVEAADSPRALTQSDIDVCTSPKAAPAEDQTEDKETCGSSSGPVALTGERPSERP